jgi:uncharacterized protein YjbI with pentapeptide repeats
VTKDFSNLDLSGQNLIGIDFSHANLQNTKLIDCNLTGANFYRADLWGAELDRSVLSHSNFERADILGAYLRDVIAYKVNFSFAYICGTDCTESDFLQSNFDHAKIFGSNFTKTNLIRTSMIDTLITSVDFKESNFNQVQWREGIEVNRSPILIQGLDYPVTIFDNHMEVACQHNTIDWFMNDTPGNRGIGAMEGLKSRRFWKRYKKPIFELIKAAGIKST